MFAGYVIGWVSAVLYVCSRVPQIVKNVRSAVNHEMHVQYCIQKMWLGGQTEFPKRRGGASVYNVLTFQKSRGGKSSFRGECPPAP